MIYNKIGGGKYKTRSAGLDIVRTIACLTVIASHFFLHTPFNSSSFEGVSMFLQGMLSSIVAGSDLYMILTGFLCCNKEVSKKFYKSGIKVILSYLFFSFLTIVVNIYIFHTGMDWKSGILGILSFSTIPYAWYIEMWIGLFLLAPFLNIWYKAIQNKKMKIYLISLIFILSSAPDFFNRYGMYLVPQYWESIYPIAFYFTGSYLREYRPCFPRTLLLTIVFLIALISPACTLIVGHETLLHIIGDRNGFFIATLSLCIFMAFYNQDVKSTFFKSVFKSISLRSLDIFLCSAIMDYYIYPLFLTRFFTTQAEFGAFYFVIIPIIFIICFSIASIKRILFGYIDKILSYLKIDITIQSIG